MRGPFVWRSFITSGTGPLYQGRFKSFPIQRDHHFLAVCRYVERNALRAALATRAEDWLWGSLHRRSRYNAAETSWLLPTSAWPVAPPRNWVAQVNRGDDERTVESIRQTLRRGAPFGTPTWRARTAARLGLESSLRPRGRPREQGRPQ